MDENKIIRKIIKRDEKGLIKFIETYGSVIKGVIVNTIPQYNYLWDEIINDTLLDVWENINSFDSSRSSFKNWCAVIAKYNAISGLRKEIRHYAEPLEDSDGYYKMEDIKDLDGFLHFIDILSKEDQIIFVNLFFKEKDYDEISEITGLSKQILYNRVSRGKTLLKENIVGEKNEKQI